MTEKDPAPTQADHDPEDTPATEGTTGNQGGTSQPGPPTDPEDVPQDVDFSEPESGEGGTDQS